LFQAFFNNLLGVELTEWLDKPQTRRAIQIERFIAEIQRAIRACGLTRFDKTFGPETRFAIQ